MVRTRRLFLSCKFYPQHLCLYIIFFVFDDVSKGGLWYTQGLQTLPRDFLDTFCATSFQKDRSSLALHSRLYNAVTIIHLCELLILRYAEEFAFLSGVTCPCHVMDSRNYLLYLHKPLHFDIQVIF